MRYGVLLPWRLDTDLEIEVALLATNDGSFVVLCW